MQHARNYQLCYGVHTANATVEKQIQSNCTERCTLQKLIYNMQNWNFAKYIIYLEQLCPIEMAY